jgi:hypothetical protein
VAFDPTIYSLFSAILFSNKAISSSSDIELVAIFTANLKLYHQFLQ